MAKTLIRPAARADFPVLLHIDQSCFPEGVAYDAAELFWYLNRKGAETLVLEDADGIAGFMILEIQPRRRRATMVTLDIKPDRRRRGYAARLLQRSEEILEGHGVELFELQVDVTNSAAMAFYEKHGFKQVGRIAGYYANGHDAYVMIRTLRPDGGG
jgi:ribosomal-protein-alanine N-acetyltransferase